MIAGPRSFLRFGPKAALVGLAALLMLPALLAPVPLNDSHALNLVWTDQFTAGLRSGDPWPRWLPASFDGLGAPVFYFYGPVAFWLVGVLGLIGLPAWPAIAITGLAALAAFGCGILILLREEGAPRAMAAAAFAVAAPYHLLDILRRGALAESVAIALLPWLALAMRRAGAGRVVPLGLAYAALIATHLPMAVLASVFLLPMLILDGAARDRTAMLRIGTGLALGTGLAAAYWLPALLLQHDVNMAAMRDAVAMHPSAWRPAWYWQSRNPALALLLAVIVALAIPAAMLRGRWGWCALGGLALAVGLCGPLWLLPPLGRVQFPWRILGLCEFAIALAIGRSRIDGAVLLLMLAPALLATAAVLTPTLLALGRPQPVREIAALLRHHPDAAEYRPRGITSDPAPISAGPQTALAVGMATGTETIVRRFAFPIWAAQCPGGIVAAGPSPSGLVRYPGHGCRLVRVRTGAERLGMAVSLLSLAGLAMIGLPRRAHARHRRPRAQSVPA